MKRLGSLVAAAVVTSALAMPAWAEDLTLSYKTAAGGKTGTATAYYTSERMRTSDGNVDTIIEYGPGRIVTIDHAKKEYSEITLAEMEASLAKMQQATAQMQQQMASMPPAVREKMEQMMGGGSVTVTKGGVRKVAGYDCQDHTVAMGTSTTVTLCTTTAVALPAANVDYRRYTSLASGMGNSAMFKGFASLAEEMKKIQGFPLAQSTSMKMMGHAVDTSREATEVKKGPVPASAFDLAVIAPGYKKVAHPITKMR